MPKLAVRRLGQGAQAPPAATPGPQGPPPHQCDVDPLQLPNGQVVQPSDPITLMTLCELFPALLKIEIEKCEAFQSLQSQGAPQPQPGQGVQVNQTGTPACFQTAGAAAISKPNSFGPASGPAGGMGGGGGGFIASGGGRAGAQGAPGQVGPQGPPGSGGVTEPPIILTGGDFTVASGSPFVPIPGSGMSFTCNSNGVALFHIQAAFASALGQVSGQLGVQVDGTIYPLTPNLFKSGTPGVNQYDACGTSFWPVPITEGPHTANLVLRGDSVLQNPTGLPCTIAANPLIPLAFTVQHP